MSKQFRGVVIAAVVIAVVIVVMLARGCGRDGGRSAQDFSSQGVTVESPDLAVRLISISGAANPGYTSWSCLLECRESDGCAAGVEAVVDFISAGEETRLRMSGWLEAETGGTMRISRPQRPAVVVDEITKISIEVVSTRSPDAPPPTPMY